MEAILTTFGIDWRLLLINAINFGLLLLGLWYFLYQPIMAMLERRRNEVTSGVEAAARAKTELKEIENSRSALLAKAGQEADGIVSSARVAGAQKEKELQAQGEAAAAVLVRDAHAQAEELKAEALAESKQEVAKLVVLGMEKLMTTRQPGLHK
jgi:F-type H+-transporting ATPase subunit b